MVFLLYRVPTRSVFAFSHFLGHEAKLRCARPVTLVLEGHWLKRQDRVAGVSHCFNIFLEALRRHDNAKLAIGAYDDWLAHHIRPGDTSNKRFLLVGSDANGVPFETSDGLPWAADVDVVIACAGE